MFRLACSLHNFQCILCLVRYFDE